MTEHEKSKGELIAERRAESLGRLYEDWAKMDARDVVERLDRAVQCADACPVVNLRQLRCAMDCLAECGIDSIPYHEIEIALVKAKSTLELIALARENKQQTIPQHLEAQAQEVD